jgi:hypothetical protein
MERLMEVGQVAKEEAYLTVEVAFLTMEAYLRVVEAEVVYSKVKVEVEVLNSEFQC